MTTLSLSTPKITQTPVSSLPTFPLSAFSTTTVKPALGASFTYLSDISLLVQKSTDVFVMDAYERKMMTNIKRGKEVQEVTQDDIANREGHESRMVVEVIKNRTGVSCNPAQFQCHAHSLWLCQPSATWVMFHTVCRLGPPRLHNLHFRLTCTVAYRMGSSYTMSQPLEVDDLTLPWSDQARWQSILGSVGRLA